MSKLPTLYVAIEDGDWRDAWSSREEAERDANSRGRVITEYLPATEAVSKERVRELVNDLTQLEAAMRTAGRGDKESAYRVAVHRLKALLEI